jgi:hypothetical protein
MSDDPIAKAKADLIYAILTMDYGDSCNNPFIIR